MRSVGQRCIQSWWGNLREKTLGRTRRRWNDIKMYLQEVGRGVMDYIDLTQDWDRWRALVSAVMNLRVPKQDFGERVLRKVLGDH